MSETNPSKTMPVNGYDFARAIIEQKGDEAIEILLGCANHAETDWFEKKASVYRSVEHDEVFKRALEKCPPECRGKKAEEMNRVLLKEIACAIVALYNSRGGVVIIGIDDNNAPVPLGNGHSETRLTMPGPEIESFIREDILGRLCPDDELFDFNGETWTIPVRNTGVCPKLCRYRESPVVALLVPSLKRDGAPLVATITRNNRPRDMVLMRSSGDIGQTLKGKDEDRWVDTEYQRKKFYEDRDRDFLFHDDLETQLKMLGISASAFPIFAVPSAPVKEVFSSVSQPRTKNFVGRERELEELHGLLAEGRIPIVTGPGGTGKSELVLQYAARNKADYPGGLFQIDMEDVTDWDQAFLSMLGKPSVRDVLGLPENDGDGIEGEMGDDPDVNMEEQAEGTGMPSVKFLKGDISRKKKSVPETLSTRVGREGPILLILDNVDPPACKTLFKETVLSKLDLPSNVKIVATARASDLTFPASGVCKEFRLSDLLPDVAVPFLLADHPEVSEDERKAAENIAQMLDYRILYLKAVPMLLEDDDSDFAGSWRALEAGLRDNLANVVVAGMEDDRDRTPDALWQLTQKTFAANRPKGDKWILLARIVSFFSPDLGVRKTILSALWKRLATPDADPDVAFAQAANKLLKHGVLDDRNGEFGMHRLTCAAIRGSSREEAPNIEQSIGLALAETGLSESRDWVSLAGSLPALRHVPEALLDGRACVDILCGNRQFADLCPWTKLDYSDWKKLLAFHPQFIGQLRQSADNGSAGAQASLGYCYYHGRGVEENAEEAVKWYRKAVEQGNASAQNNLGNCYYKGSGVEKNAEEAVKWYRKATNQGYAIAQSNLGLCYENGRGVEKNAEEAVKWYRKAAEQGYATAQSNLGRCYEKGRGVEESAEEAVKWYRKSAEQGYAAAQKYLGYCYYHGRGVEENAEEAVKWYRKSAEQGYAAAQNNLGRCYEKGRGVEKNAEEAVKWYRKAAEQGYATAQSNLGVCYYNGCGVEENFEEAVKWYRKAAEQGNAYAQNNLGLCYDNGRGVEKSAEEAVKWYRKSAEQGYDAGECHLGQSLLLGIGVEKDEEAAVRYFHAAAEQKNEKAFAWLGYCFASGTGTTRNENETAAWFAKLGNPADGFNEIAWGLFKAGRFSDALPFAERAVAAFRADESFPVHSRINILDTLAAVLDALGRAEETKSACEEILALYSTDDMSRRRENALVRLGRACQRLGDKAGAVDAYGKALAIVERHGGKHTEYGESADSLRALLTELSERS
ncbi:MAG: SEL1-like repeat protein [Kiritimatiellae bacterium]|nr:SEL1-like repeat protein [Kiritimatiellia bacterium]